MSCQSVKRTTPLGKLGLGDHVLRFLERVIIIFRTGRFVGFFGSGQLSFSGNFDLSRKACSMLVLIGRLDYGQLGFGAFFMDDAHAKQRLSELTVAKRLENVLFCLPQCNPSLQLWQLNCKSTNGTPVLHAEKSFISAEKDDCADGS